MTHVEMCYIMYMRVTSVFSLYMSVFPFFQKDSTYEWDRTEISAVMKIYEEHTCLRFVPWEEDENGTTTNDRLGLGHGGYLKFVLDGGRCWSFLGNLKYGQDISCCHGSVCIHELGHALGFAHEQQNPDPDVNWLIRLNPENIMGSILQFYR